MYIYTFFGILVHARLSLLLTSRQEKYIVIRSYLVFDICKLTLYDITKYTTKRKFIEITYKTIHSSPIPLRDDTSEILA